MEFKRRVFAVFVLLAIILFGGILLYKSAKHPSFSMFQKRTDEYVEVHFGSNLSQTFYSDEGFITAIRLPVVIKRVENVPSSTLSVCIFEMSVTSPREISCKKILLPRNKNIDEIIFSFPVQIDSFGKTFLLTIKTDAPSGIVFFYDSFFDSYPNGSLRVNDLEIQKDLAFQVYLRPPLLYLEFDLPNYLNRMFAIVSVMIVVMLCGYFVGFWIPIKSSTEDISLQIVLYNSIGLAIPILILYILALFNFHVSSRMISRTFFLIVVVFLIAYSTMFLKSSHKKKISIGISKATLHRDDILVFLLFVFAVIIRLLQIKDLQVPNWIDGLVHSNILDKIHYRGIIPVKQIYHIGFHLDAFFLQSILKFSSQETILIFGQWLSISCGMSFYYLIRQLIKDRFIAILSLGFYWFLVPFPSYLVSWGRYPYLLGLTLLPIALVTSINWLRSATLARFFIAMLFSVSLFIAHYSVLIIWIVFVFSYVIFNHKKEHSDASMFFTKKLLLQVFLLLTSLLLLVFPKVKTLLNDVQCEDGVSGLIGCVRQVVAPFHFFEAEIAFPEGPVPDTISDVVYQVSTLVFNDDVKHVFELTLGVGGWIIWLLGLLGLSFLYHENVGYFFVFLSWILSLFFISCVQTLFLGVALPNMVNLLIFISLPLTFFCTYFLQFIISKSTQVLRGVCAWGMIAIIVTGGYAEIGIVNPSTTLFYQEDGNAVEWIWKNTTGDEVILINSFLWGGHYVASDGGCWITPLTGRKTVYPLMNLEFADISRLIEIKGVDYVYLGRGYGGLNKSMFNNKGFSLVYDSGGILVYKVNKP